MERTVLHIIEITIAIRFQNSDIRLFPRVQIFLYLCIDIINNMVNDSTHVTRVTKFRLLHITDDVNITGIAFNVTNRTDAETQANIFVIARQGIKYRSSLLFFIRKW